jgi:hypothetical protein
MDFKRIVPHLPGNLAGEKLEKFVFKSINYLIFYP